MLLLVLGTVTSLSLPAGLQNQFQEGLKRQREAFASLRNALTQGLQRHNAAIQEGVNQRNPVAIAVAGIQEEFVEGAKGHNAAIKNLNTEVKTQFAEVQLRTGAQKASAKAQIGMGADVVGNVVKTVGKINDASQQGAPIAALSRDMHALEITLALPRFKNDKELQNKIRSQRYIEFQERLRQIKGPAAGQATRVVTMDKWSRLRLTISVRIESIKESLKLAIKIPQIVINMIQQLDQASKKTNPSKDLLAVIAQSQAVLKQLKDSSDISKEALTELKEQILLMERDILQATKGNHPLRRR